MNDEKNEQVKKKTSVFASIYEKIEYILSFFIYGAFAVLITYSSCVIFERNTYTNIYVSGKSMTPTLIGGNEWHHYGIADESRAEVARLKRFDVIIAYYPKSWMGGVKDTVFKVKRLWGLPGETISLSHYVDNTNPEEPISYVYFEATRPDGYEYSITAQVYDHMIFNNIEGTQVHKVAHFVLDHKKFFTNLDSDSYRVFENLQLGNDEYFVMGDNWNSSTDSYKNVVESGRENLNNSNIRGRVLCIQGVAYYDSAHKRLYNKHPIEPMYSF